VFKVRWKVDGRTQLGTESEHENEKKRTKSKNRVTQKILSECKAVVRQEDMSNVGRICGTRDYESRVILTDRSTEWYKAWWIDRWRRIFTRAMLARAVNSRRVSVCLSVHPSVTSVFYWMAKRIGSRTQRHTIDSTGTLVIWIETWYQRETDE